MDYIFRNLPGQAAILCLSASSLLVAVSYLVLRLREAKHERDHWQDLTRSLQQDLEYIKRDSDYWQGLAGSLQQDRDHWQNRRRSTESEEM